MKKPLIVQLKQMRIVLTSFLLLLFFVTQNASAQYRLVSDQWSINTAGTSRDQTFTSTSDAENSSLSLVTGTSGQDGSTYVL